VTVEQLKQASADQARAALIEAHVFVASTVREQRLSPSHTWAHNCRTFPRFWPVARCSCKEVTRTCAQDRFVAHACGQHSGDHNTTSHCTRGLAAEGRRAYVRARTGSGLSSVHATLASQGMDPAVVEQTNAIAKDFVASYFDFIDSNRRRLGGLYVNPPLHNRVF
jgi:hypothetical protein